MKGHETFEHTADIGIRAWGDQFTEVFEEAARALFSVMVNLKDIQPRETVRFELVAEAGEELLLKWLKELLFTSDTRKILFSEFKVLDLTSEKLIAEARGEPLDRAKHSLGSEVKAITRHQFKLVRDKGRYLAEVLLDI